MANKNTVKEEGFCSIGVTELPEKIDTKKPKLPSLSEKYMEALGNPHNNIWNIASPNCIDYFLRDAIGKTDDIEIPRCAHNTIRNKELNENFCRICSRELKVGIGRWNDYLFLRHPKCTKPICQKCAEEKPDAFHIAYRQGLKKLKEKKTIQTFFKFLDSGLPLGASLDEITNAVKSRRDDLP